MANHRDVEHEPELERRLRIHYHFYHCLSMLGTPAASMTELPEFVATQFPLPPGCPEGRLHVIMAGETLAEIGRRLGIPLSAMIAANPQLTDPNVLFPGQTICIPEAAGPGFPPPPAVCPEGRFHVIQSGETLSTIAAASGLSLGTIVAANPQLTDPNLVFPGQTICLPGTAGPGQPPIPPPCPEGRLYTVAPGETLSAIATRFGITLSRLLAANPRISNPDLIFAGQVICLPLPADTVPPGTPPPPPSTCSGQLYQVARGDTLSSISRRFRVTVNAILAANPQIANPNLLVVGQMICVPVAT